MPLNIYVERKGKRRKDLIWDQQMLDFCYTVAYMDEDPDREYQTGKKFGDLGTWVFDPEEKDKSKYSGQEFEKYVTFQFGVYYIDGKCGLVTQGEQMVKHKHRFFHAQSGKPVVFLPGDKIVAWRSHKS
jgi:hypothetical protein